MMRLIDADALCRSLSDWQFGSFATVGHETEYSLIDAVLVGIGAAPAIDAVPVVRCRECKQWYKECDASWPEPAWGHCDCDRFWGLDIGFHTPEYFFCADSERKDGADNG